MQLLLPIPMITSAMLFLMMTMMSSTIKLSYGHNITTILSDHPEFSTFNHYLSTTHLAEEINRRLTITVLAVDNDGMSKFLVSKKPTLYTIRNVLSFHILADYFGDDKLHQISNRSALVASLFQATGSAPGTTGFVNITNIKGGRVAFGAEDNNGVLNAEFVKTIKEIPYNISVVKITGLLNSPEAEAPATGPIRYNITTMMSREGCKVFAYLVASTANVAKIFETDIGSNAGFTLFCPTDAAMTLYLPKYGKLTNEARSTLLLFHALPTYTSMQTLKTGGTRNVQTTLAGSGYNFTVRDTEELVEIKTGVEDTVKITGTVIDAQPLVIFTVDHVLEPNELFDESVDEKPTVAGGGGRDSDTLGRRWWFMWVVSAVLMGIVQNVSFPLFSVW